MQVPRWLRVIFGFVCLVMLAAGFALFSYGGFEAGVFENVGLDPDWKSADPVALVVAGSFLVQLILIGLLA